jgi:hypothetical protein
VTVHDYAMELPLAWKKPQVVFVNSVSNLFHEGSGAPTSSFCGRWGSAARRIPEPPRPPAVDTGAETVRIL